MFQNLQRNSLIQVLIVLHIISFSFYVASAESQEQVLLQETLNQSARIESLLDEDYLSHRNILHIDFDANSNAWIATSDGLIFYDGYTWKRYSTRDGLPSNLVRCICMTKDGTLWVGTDRGSGTFDGKQYETHGSEKGLAGPSVHRIREDSEGTLWFCSDHWPDATVAGGLTSFKNNQWEMYGENDGIAYTYVLDFFEDSQKRRFVSTQRGLYQWENGRWENPLRGKDYPFINEPVFSIAESSRHGLVVSWGEKICILKDNQWSVYPNNKLSAVLQAATQRGEIIAVPQNALGTICFLEWKDHQFKRLTQDFLPPSATMQTICEAPDGSIWCAGYNYIVRWDRSNTGWVQYDVQLPPPKFIDSQNAIWFSDESRSFRLKDNQILPMDSSLTNARQDSNGVVWGWDENRLTRYSVTDDTTQRFPEAQCGLYTTLGFKEDSRGRLWFYGMDQGAFPAISIYESGTWKKIDTLSYYNWSIVDCASGPGEGMWFMMHHKADGENRLFHITEKTFDSLPLLTHIPPFSRTQFLFDSNGRLWIYGHYGLFSCNPQKKQWEQMPDSGGINGRFLFESGDSLIFGFDGYSGGRAGWSQYKDGQWKIITKDFQRFYYISKDEDIYLGGENKLYIIPKESTAVPIPFNLPVEGTLNGMLKEPSDKIWLNVDGKTFRYTPSHTPPETVVISQDTSIRSDGTLNVRVQGLKRFVLPQEETNSFTFSYRIDGRPWHNFQARTIWDVPASILSAGDHALFVRAQDENFNIDPTPAVLHFSVHWIPLQEQIWFFPILYLTGLLFVALALITYNAKRKLAIYARNLESIVKERTASLEKSEEQFRNIFENAVLGIYRTTSSGQILMANPNLIQMLGYDSFEELSQTNVMDGYENPPLRKKFMERIEREGLIQGYESAWRKKDGSFLIIRENAKVYRDGSGNIIYYEGTIEDITEQKEAEEALRQSEERFRSVVNASKDAMIEINPRGEITLFNPAAEELFGYPKEDMLGQPLDRILPDGQCGHHRQYLQNYFTTGSPNNAINKTLELNAVRSGGKVFPIDLSLSAGYHGDEQFVLALIRDISLRKELEEQLRQSQKMEAIGNLAGGIAHDFNNLLTGILGYSDLFLVKTERDHPQYQSIEQIKKAAESAASLTRQLLAFSRKQILEPVILDLNHLIGNMDTMLRRLIGEDINLIIKTTSSLELIKADPGQIEQIILNISINARDAMPHGGTLTIETLNAELDNSYMESHREIVPGRYVLMAMSDTGQGMEKSIRERIFDPFFTTKEKGKGTGLGLSTVYGIVKQSGGHIFVYSEINQGTTFKIYFPVVDGSRTTVRQSTHEQMALEGNEIILLVEDEEIVRDMIITVFQDRGYTVLSAGGHEEAIRIVERHPDVIHLLISDVVLPQMSGPQLAKILLEKKSGMQVLYMSGYTENAIVHHGVLDEEINFIHKPFTPEGLLKRVRQILDSA